MSTTACLISANDISREGLAFFLRSEGFELFSSISGIEHLDVTRTDSYLAVIDDPEPAGQIEAVDGVLACSPNAKVVILAEAFNLETMLACFRAGAHGYIVKTMRSQPMMASLRLVALGEKVMPSVLIDNLDRRPASHPAKFSTDYELDSANLSPRERDVLCGLMAGYSNKLIARQLTVCEATIKVHVKAILRKLKVCNRTQAAIWANSNGLTESRNRVLG